MKRIAFVFFFFLLLSSCTPDGRRMSDQELDSIAAQNSEVDTFSVSKHDSLTPAQKKLTTLNKIDTAKNNSDSTGIPQNVTLAPLGTDIVVNPDIFPAYPGGEMAMQNYIVRNKIYPLVAFQNEIKGTVNVKFVVETDGSISGIKVISGIGYGCDESAVDLVRKMPKWIPGKKGGVNVRCYVILPLSFGE